MDIGFVGAGKMGLPIAVNIARNGSEKVRLLDARPVTLPEEARDAGIELVTEIEQLATCDTVVLCLPDSRVVSAVVEGQDGKSGLADLLSPGAIIVDCGSSLASETLRLAGLLSEREIRFFDAPVSGGLPKAWKGELTVLAGGVDSAPDRVREILRRFGSNIVPFANVGDGHVIKAANNYLLAANMVTCMEALAFAVSSGVSVAQFAQAVNGSSGRSYVSEIKVPIVEDREAPVGFTAGLIRKDVANFIAALEATGLSLPMPGHVLETWDDAVASLGPDADSMRIFDVLSRAGE